MSLTGKFYAPISAGGMNHIGAQPQNNVTFPIAHPVGPQSTVIVRSSSMQPPTITRQGMLPSTVTPIRVGMASAPSTTGGPVSLGFVNWINHPHS